jgi:hypothetical protein
MKFHPLNVSYLVVGLAFIGIAGSWALSAADVIDASDVGWLVPLSLVAAGVIGLVAFAAKGFGRRGAEPQPDPGYDYDYDYGHETAYDTGYDTGQDAGYDTGSQGLAAQQPGPEQGDDR